MNTIREIWKKLSSGKEYRKEFVASLLKRGTAMQIQSLLKERGWTQAKLAQESGIKQGVISRAQNPAYGNLTFNTVIDIAAGFDVAFIGRFVPFTELAQWIDKMRDDMQFVIPSFDTENGNPEEVLEKLEALLAGAEKASTKGPKRTEAGAAEEYERKAGFRKEDSPALDRVA